jgi:hypothetical protein
VYIWATTMKTPEGHVGYEAQGEQKSKNVTSRPEPFLHNPQKKFGTPRVSIVHGFAPVPRGRVGHPPSTNSVHGFNGATCCAKGCATRLREIQGLGACGRIDLRCSTSYGLTSSSAR